jgi:hypothetical protein
MRHDCKTEQSIPPRMQSLSDAFERYSTSYFFTWSARDAYSIGVSFFVFALYFRDSIALESRLQRACETPCIPALPAGVLLVFLLWKALLFRKSGPLCSLHASIAITISSRWRSLLLPFSQSPVCSSSSNFLSRSSVKISSFVIV